MDDWDGFKINMKKQYKYQIGDLVKVYDTFRYMSPNINEEAFLGYAIIVGTNYGIHSFRFVMGTYNGHTSIDLFKRLEKCTELEQLIYG